MRSCGSIASTKHSSSFGSAIEMQPDHVVALHRRGLALMSLERHDEALESFDKALYVAPRNRALLNSYGSALLALGRADDALTAFDKSLAITPGATRRARAARHRATGARASYRSGRQRRTSPAAISHDAEAHYDRGLSLWALGKHEEAIASYEKASACNHPRALSKLAIGRLIHGRLGSRRRSRRRVAQSHCGRKLRRSVDDLSFRVRTVGTAECGQELRSNLHTCRQERASSIRPLDRIDKLRIAYLSADFRRHPVGVAIAELLERHDKTRFEIIGVSHGPNDASGTRERASSRRSTSSTTSHPIPTATSPSG